MSAPSRPRTVAALVAAVVGALALGLPGLPAAAASSAAAPVAAAAPDPGYTVEKTGGITALSVGDQVESTGREVFDTRLPWTSTGAARPLGAQGTLTVDLTKQGLTVPADATGVILNVTAISPTRAGWLAVWPSDRSRPTASTLNFAPGTPTPNLAVVPVTATRKLTVLNGSSGSTHLRVTFSGWVRSNGGTQRPGALTPTNGTRIVDTRSAGPAVPAKGYRDITVAGHGVPSGAAAALLDVIAVKPTRAGYLVAHPADTARPTATTLTYRVGGDRAALSLVRLAATGKVRVWNMSSAPVHLVVDAFGWVAGGDSTSSPAGVAAVKPVRVVDTRGKQVVSSRSGGIFIPVPGDDRTEYAARPSGVVLAITTVNATASGHLMIDVDGNGSRNVPNFTQSIVNVAPHETATNTTFVSVPSTGRLAMWTNVGQVDAVVDVVGVVRHRAEVAGHLVAEADGAPVNPGLAGADPTYAPITVRTGSSGAYQHTRGDLTASTQMCGTGALDTGAPDPSWAVACLGGRITPVSVPLALGTRVVADDIRVPRVGSAAGVVTAPAGSSPVGALVALQRVDHQYLVPADVRADGTWRMPAVPVGTYVALVRGPNGSLVGEAVHDLPLDVSGATSSPVRLGRLLGAGARTFVVSAGAATAVDDATVLPPGTLKGVVVDPDGNLGDVTVEWRHGSGYLLTSGPATSTPLTHVLRPGAWVLCATEGDATRCSGGASSFAEAAAVTVASDSTVTTTVTLP